jgi:hypothetical protein
MTDVSAIAFVIGPLTGLVFPCVIVALVLTGAALARNLLKVLRTG